MVVEKNGITMSIQPQFLKMYESCGWNEVVDKPEVGRVEIPEVEETETVETKLYTEEELLAMKSSEIKKLGKELGYTITAVAVKDCVKQFLNQQK